METALAGCAVSLWSARAAQAVPAHLGTHSLLRTVPAQGWQLGDNPLGTNSLANTIQHPQILMCLLPALSPAPCHLWVALARQGTDPCGFSKKFLVISPKAKAAATGSSWHGLGWAHRNVPSARALSPAMRAPGHGDRQGRSRSRQGSPSTSSPPPQHSPWGTRTQQEVARALQP